MSSPDTHEPLSKLLRERRYYGLQAAQVHVFCCDATPPALNADLKVVLEGAAKLSRPVMATSGELLPALHSSGMLKHMRRAGEHVLIRPVPRRCYTHVNNEHCYLDTTKLVAGTASIYTVRRNAVSVNA